MSGRDGQRNIPQLGDVCSWNAPFVIPGTCLYFTLLSVRSPTLLFCKESNCGPCRLFRAVSNAKYSLVSVSLTLPFIRLFLSSLSCPLPHQSHWCVCGWVFCRTKQWQASSVWLSVLVLVICRSHTVHWLPIMMSWRREAEGEMRWRLLLLCVSR